ncbi:MAG: hypothetical protein IAG10_05135 [Planctomycetaceae bacterium]|nr:hypothetical protein [Planctomycetaceae bacterium]
MIVLSAAVGAACLSSGCEKKERVLEIKTPGLEIEVDKTKDGIEIETSRKRDKVVDIEVPGAEIEIKKD